MALSQRGEYWYGDSGADIHELMARHRESGDPIEIVRDVICECGGRVFSVQLDDEYQEAAWICRSCDAQYLFHAKRVKGYYEGDPDADTEYCRCPCTPKGGSYFELAVGVSLYTGREDVDWVFLGCQCVACGLTGYLTEWHRVEYPHAELFSHMANKQEA